MNNITVQYYTQLNEKPISKDTHVEDRINTILSHQLETKKNISGVYKLYEDSKVETKNVKKLLAQVKKTDSNIDEVNNQLMGVHEQLNNINDFIEKITSDE